jgi:formylglycine-generating enzyme required for sulfatase activity
MIVVPGPVEFAMGSPDDEPGRSSNEVLHQQRINRSFAVAAVPVTVEQFERFLKARPGTRQALNEGRGDLFVKRYSPQPDRPMIVVNWFMAAEYCNWLSGQEGLPPEEWCYEPTMVPASVLLARTVASLGSSGQPRPLLALCDMALSSGRDLAGEYGEGMRMK